MSKLHVRDRIAHCRNPKVAAEDTAVAKVTFDVGMMLLRLFFEAEDPFRGAKRGDCGGFVACCACCCPRPPAQKHFWETRDHPDFCSISGRNWPPLPPSHIFLNFSLPYSFESEPTYGPYVTASVGEVKDTERELENDLVAIVRACVCWETCLSSCLMLVHIVYWPWPCMWHVHVNNV